MSDIGSALASAVIFLFAYGQSGQVPIGTAFIVGYPIPGHTDQFIPLVVTAKHVIGNHPRVSGRFSTHDGKAPVTLEYDLQALRRSGDYWEHSDQGVDLAVFRTTHYSNAKYNPIPLDLVASRKDFVSESVQTTDRVIFPGLLVKFMGLAQNYPIVRSGSIAMIPDEPIPMRYYSGGKLVETRQEAILVDGTAVQGESGSPVFLWPGPRLRNGGFDIGGTKPLVLGVLQAFYPAEPREIRTMGADGKHVFEENSDVAVVIPSWRLREIMESEPLRDRMRKLIDSERD